MFKYIVKIRGAKEKLGHYGFYDSAIRFIYRHALRDSYKFWQRIDYGDKEEFLFYKDNNKYPLNITAERIYIIIKERI